MTEIMAAQPENANGAAQLPELPQRVPGQGFQKRIDKLVREKHELRTENNGLRLAIQEYEEMITKYKTALSAARRKNGQ